MKIPIYKQLISYVHPTWIRAGRSTDGTELELLLYRGRWQLATADAIYSDGDRYTPMLTAYKALGKRLESVKTVLVLGSGLGSAVQVMSRKGYSPAFTLVDNEELILNWARELMPEYNNEIQLVKADAMFYLDMDSDKYDLLIVDVFVGRAVPDFITTRHFIENCRSHVSDGGSFVLNYIINGSTEWENFKGVLDAVFPENKVIENGINRIVVATA